ncbi:MAG: GNAT family N-acetyltransferase [Promethearchaeota archaeon]
MELEKGKVTCRAARGDEVEWVLEMIDLSFSEEPSSPRRQPFTRFLAWEPLASPGHLRVAEVGGEVVAACIVVPFTVELGNVALHVAGFTGVATHPDYRHRGYALALMCDAARYLHGAGYDAGTLQAGVPSLYAKAGYSHCYTGKFEAVLDSPRVHGSRAPKWASGASGASRASGTSGFEVELVIPTEYDLGARSSPFDEIHGVFLESPAKNLHGFRVLRSKRRFSKRAVFEGWTLLVVRRGAEVVAYATIKPNFYSGEVRVLEFYSREEDERVYEAGLRGLVDEVGDALKRLVVHYLPTQDALLGVLREWGASENHGLLSPHMAALFDPADTFRRLLPNFNARLQDAGVDLPTTHLTLEVTGVGGGDAVAEIHALVHGNFVTLEPRVDEGVDEGVDASGRARPRDVMATLPVETFTQLVFGTAPAGELLEDEPLWGDPVARELFDVLFHPLDPSWPPGDPF